MKENLQLVPWKYEEFYYHYKMYMLKIILKIQHLYKQNAEK